MGSLTDDLTGALDQAQVKRILNSALDWVRPFHLAIGFRVRKLSRSQVEALIPARPHNLNSIGEVEEAVIISVALQMVKLMIARWEVPVTADLDQIRFERLQALKGELNARLEWEDLSREALRADLVQNRNALNDWYVHLYDSQEKHVADVQLTMKIRLPQSLTGKASHANHSKRS